jgi:uncharacterized protein HemX
MLARRVRTLAGAAVATVLLLGMGSYAFVRHIGEQRVQAELKLEEERRAVETEANRKVEEAEKLRLAGLKAEQERERRPRRKLSIRARKPSNSESLLLRRRRIPRRKRRFKLIPKVLSPL